MTLSSRRMSTYIYIYIYIYSTILAFSYENLIFFSLNKYHDIHIHNRISVRQWPRRPGFNPMSSHTFGVLGYFGPYCWLLMSDSVSFLLPHLNLLGVFLSVKTQKEENEERKEVERKDIFSISTLFHLGVSRGFSVARNVLLAYLRTVVSPKSGIEIY